MQRCAIIGDVHAEDERLRVALSAASSFGLDAIACTGDVVDGRGSVARCCALLREHGVWCIRGNHDRWLFTGLLRDAVGATRLDDLCAEDQLFLRSLPATRDVPIPGGLMLLCHGIGAADLEKITSVHCDYWLREHRALKALTQSGQYRVMVNGHSHERLVARIDTFVIINAGTLAGDDPGFLVLDFAENLMRWWSIRDSEIAMTTEAVVFTP